jgi:acid phosphatase
VVTHRGVPIALLALTLACATACTTSKPGMPATPPTSAPPSTQGSSAPATTSGSTSAPVGHVVVVMMENHSYADIIGSSSAPYINSLASHGADLTSMFSITHPSQPNYVALFSGDTHGVTSDVCPQLLTGANLGSELRSAGLTFAGYSEDLPNTGNQTCAAGPYARKHVPWTDFPNLPGTVSQPFSDFPTDFAKLPALSFVVPNLDHDMHDGTVAQGDTWLRANLQGYVAWAATHDSQLVITWDEDDHSQNNQIPTVIVGAGVAAQRVGTHVTLYSLLRYLEDRFALPHLGKAATATPISLTA